MVLSPSQRLVLLDPRATRRVSLTRSGGYIADDNDSSGLLHLPGATWIGPAVSNLWAGKARSAAGGSTVTQDSAEYPILAGVSDKVVTPGSGANEGITIASADVSAATTYTASAIVKAPVGATLYVLLDERTAGDVFIGSIANANLLTDGAVQRITVTGATTTGVKLRLRILTLTNPQAITFYAAGWMSETGAVANPYTATSRSAGRGQMPWDAGLYTGAMGSVAVLFRAGYASTAAINPTLFAHGPDNNNGLRFDYRDATDSFTMRRANAGSSGEKASSASSHAVGDYVFVVGVWTPTGLASSRNGEATLNTVTADTNIPTLSGSADLGGNANVFSGRELTGDAAWVALFRYPMVNSEAAAIYNAFGQSGRPKPTIRSLDQVARGAHATAVFDGRGQVFDRRIAS